MFLAWISDHDASLLAAFFILYGAVFASLFAINMPPFQNADEVSHSLRAAQISRGLIVGTRHPDGSSGGMVDHGLVTAVWPFGPLPLHTDTKVTSSMYAAAAHGWTRRYEWQNFANTAVYSPVFYIPAAAALWVSRHMNLSILSSLYLARLSNAVVAIMLGGFGIYASGRAAPFLFAVLSLPMALALMPDVSQDGVMIGCTAAAAGLLAGHLQRSPGGSVGVLVAVSVALALLCMARPPYAPLAVVPLALPGPALRPRLTAVAAILMACASWSGFAALNAMGVLRPDDPAVDPTGQIHWIAKHLLQTGAIVLFSIRVEASALLEQFIGRLGYLDTTLPATYIQAQGFLLLLAAVLAFDVRRQDEQPHAGHVRFAAAFVTGIAILASVALLFLFEFVTWNDVGRAVIEGVQGRYLLPLALIAATMLPAFPPAPQWWCQMRAALIAVLLVFPAVSIGVAIRAVVLRYYLT